VLRICDRHLFRPLGILAERDICFADVFKNNFLNVQWSTDETRDLGNYWTDLHQIKLIRNIKLCRFIYLRKNHDRDRSLCQTLSSTTLTSISSKPLITACRFSAFNWWMLGTRCCLPRSDKATWQADIAVSSPKYMHGGGGHLSALRWTWWCRLDVIAWRVIAAAAAAIAWMLVTWDRRRKMTSATVVPQHR